MHVVVGGFDDDDMGFFIVRLHKSTQVCINGSMRASL